MSSAGTSGATPGSSGNAAVAGNASTTGGAGGSSSQSTAGTTTSASGNAPVAGAGTSGASAGTGGVAIPVGEGDLGPADYAQGELDAASDGATITFQDVGGTGWYPSRRDPASGMCSVMLRSSFHGVS